jgi:4-hydroxyphenylpyruvate dioxygenase
MVDVADPDGLVRSQAVRSGGLRVTLNGAEARRTLAGRFVEESFGSAVQHIAFATDDIFATAAAGGAGFRCCRSPPTTMTTSRRASACPDLTARMQAAECAV